MSGAPKDFYASMVLKSNYPDVQHPAAQMMPPSKGPQPYRSPYYSSATANPAMMPMLAQPFALPVAHGAAQMVPAHMLRPTVYLSMSGYETYDPAKHATKMYTHNPYASACTSAPVCLAPSPSLDGITFGSPYIASRTSSMVTPHSSSASAFPVYAATESSSGTTTTTTTTAAAGAAAGGGEAAVLTSTLEEQFLAVVGSIAATAITSRGRHLLLNVLRLQHMDKIQIIYDELVPQFNTIALDQHGCHVVRTLIEFISTAQMEALVPRMDPGVVLHLATATQHTRRVLQAVFEHHKSDALMPLVDAVKSDCQRLSMNQQGCIAIIRIIEYARPQQKRALIDAVVPVLSSLATNQFGNYVVQCILKNMDGFVSVDDLVGSFEGHWVALSCDKYSSNVMEKIVGMLKGPSRQRIVNELIFDHSHLQCLMQNSFGNYVLQAVIGSAGDQYEFGLIYDTVTPFLHTSPYGHRIEAKLKGRYEALYTKGGMPITMPMAVPALPLLTATAAAPPAEVPTSK